MSSVDFHGPVDLNLADIGISPLFSSLFVIDSALLATITQNMRDRGYDLEQPIHVWRSENVIIDGHTRRQCAIDAGITVIPVFLHDFESEDEALKRAISLNSERRQFTDVDIARCILAVDSPRSHGAEPGGRGNQYVDGKASDEALPKGKTAEVTAKIVGVSLTRVERVRGINKNKFFPGLIDDVLAGRIGISAADQQVASARRVAKEAAAKEAAAKEAAAKAAAAKEATDKEPAADPAPAEEPAADPAPAEEPAAEEPAAEEPAAEEPAAEEPAAEEPAAEVADVADADVADVEAADVADATTNGVAGTNGTYSSAESADLDGSQNGSAAVATVDAQVDQVGSAVETELSPEEETIYMEDLGRDWAAMVRELNEKGQLNTPVGDQRRAGMFVNYRGKGLSFAKIASGLDRKPAYVKNIRNYLVYHRFISGTNSSIASKVTKDEFLIYWNNVRDDAHKKAGCNLSAADEQGYFKHIEKLVKEGTTAVKLASRKRAPDVDTVNTARKLKKEIQRLYKEDLGPHLTDLIRMLNADRSEYAPSSQAAAADKVKQAFKYLKQLLDEFCKVPKS